MTRPSILAVTSAHERGWNDYGLRMAKLWLRHWPVPLVVYTEGYDCNVPGVTVHDIHRIAWLRDFKKKHPYKRQGPYNYKFDAAKFAHKVAVVIGEAVSCGADYLIWVDADTVTHAPVPESFVDSLLPTGNEYIAWLDRTKNYFEGGFYILNMRHPWHLEAMERWLSLYTTGDIFKLPQWHDCWTLQHVVTTMRLEAKSLSGNAARETGHPFINGPLGAYMDHMKGQRKRLGKSPIADLKVVRDETYWKRPR
jgi:hypothetical protein